MKKKKKKNKILHPARIKDRSGCIICWIDRAIRDSKSDGKEGRGEGAALWPAIKRRAKGHEIKGEGGGERGRWPLLTLGVAILRTRWQPIGGAKIELRRDWPTSPRDLLVIVPDLENWPVAEFPMPYAKGFPSLTRQFSSPPLLFLFSLSRRTRSAFFDPPPSPFFISFSFYFPVSLYGRKEFAYEEKLGRLSLLLLVESGLDRR